MTISSTEFLIESEENLDQLDRDLVALEEHPESDDLLSSIFRTIHTIKGTCCFLSFTKLEDLTHVGESLLRDGDLVLTSKLTDALLAMIDAVRTMLTTIEDTGNDGDDPCQDLMARLKELQQPAKSSPDSQSEDDASGDQTHAAPGEKESADAQDPVASPPGKTGVSADGIDMAVSVSPAATPTGNPSPSPNANFKVRGRSIAESAIRVDVSLLDRLMNLVGELVLTRNQILQYTQSQGDTAFLGTSQHLNLITTELQEGVMKTRMQLIGNIWGKLPRVVRDLAHSFGKQIRLEMEGKETELDKTLIEAIKDPLTHLVRNAVDHGVESPEERVRAGKPREGCVSLRAYHEGGHVNIEISDDGAGIDVEKIKAAALERGLITQEQAS